MKKKINFHSIRFRILAVMLVVSLLIIAGVEFTVFHAVRDTVEETMLSRLEGDINYLQDLIGDGEWHTEDGMLYFGERPIGDGTAEHAYTAPFVELEEKTGTFSYVFLRFEDSAGVGYMRAAGSELDYNGRQIVGTVMENSVVAQLDAEGIYSESTEVAGYSVFSLYRAVKDDDGNPLCVLVVGRGVEEIEARSREVAVVIFLLVTVLVLLADAVLTMFLSRWITKLDTANRYLRDISTGAFPDEPLDLHTSDELMMTAQCVNEMTAALKENARRSGELAVAANIQQHMLPQTFPERKEFDICAAMHPAKEVGGDFYDFFMPDDNRLAIVIADVSGKGVPGALVMAIAKILIKNHTQTGQEPRQVFENVNRLLCEGNRLNIFVTAWLGILDLTDGTLTYVNAGHNPPLLRQNGSFAPLQAPPGMVLGAFEGIRYTQNTLRLQSGDRLFLYTDGVTEAEGDGGFYGMQRLTEFLNSRSDDAAGMLRGLKADIDAFAGTFEQTDDITMLLLDFLRPTRVRTTERTFRAAEDVLPEVTDFVEDAAADTPLSRTDLSRLLIVTEELFVNIAHYAYPQGDGSVDVAVRAGETSVTLRFADSGIPFNPLETPEPDVTLPAEERDIGGLGILMATRLADSFRYERKENRNICEITKKIT